jgi:hypothetical protein
MSDTMSDSDTIQKTLSDKLSSLLIIICILGMCIVVYGISEMIVKNKDYPVACKVLYLPGKYIEKTNYDDYMNKLDPWLKRHRNTSIPEVYLRKRETNMFAEDQGDFSKYDYLYE